MDKFLLLYTYNMLSGTFYQPFLFQIPQNKRTPRVNDSDGFSRTFFYPGGIYAMIGFCNHKNGSRSLPDQSSVSASFHHMDAGPAIHPCPLLMITVETQNFNLISQDFYDKTVFSLDLALIPCSCGHTGCLIWHGSYTRKVILEDQILSLRISRVRCQNCGCTHAILLSSIVPYSQIPLSIHVSVARSYENGNPLCSVLRRQTHLDENHISSLARSYRSHWRERLRAISARTSSLRDLVRTCFAVFSRQFMQIKTTRNKLFLLPT